MAALYARNMSDDENAMTDQTKILPSLRTRVANRLVDHAAVRTVEKAAASVAEMNAKMFPLLVLLDLRDPPRSGYVEQTARVPDSDRFESHDRIPPPDDVPDAPRREGDRNRTTCRER